MLGKVPDTDHLLGLPFAGLSCGKKKTEAELLRRRVLYTAHITYQVQAQFLAAGSHDSIENKQKGSDWFLIMSTTLKLCRHIHFIIHSHDKGGSRGGEKGPSHNFRTFRRTKFAASKIQVVSSMQSKHFAKGMLNTLQMETWALLRVGGMTSGLRLELPST